MSRVTAKEIREKYLKFFSARGGSAFGGKGHKIIPSASLIPENDPSVLFTTAGMHPLVPFLLGEKHPLGSCLASCQKCIRTNDIEDVGDATHLTFFEMLGNWSLGDYFKEDAIKWSFEFLTKELKIPLEKLAFSVFAGEEEIPEDAESFEIWRGLGVSEKRIKYLGREDNWWGPAGKTGPCGPDTEMFYWTGKEKAPEIFDPNDKRWVEIWNDVFMQYNKKIKNQKSKIKITNQNVKIGKEEEEKKEYEFVPLKQKNVDTGMGLERMTAVMQGKDNVYETELFEPITEKVKSQKSKVKNTGQNSKIDEIKAERIIADHLKAATFLLAERLTPSNTERGYVLRRLIRRAVRYGKLLGIEKEFTAEIAKVVIEIYKDIYPELTENQDFIFNELQREERKFSQKLEEGIKELKKLFGKVIGGIDPDNLPPGMLKNNKLRIEGDKIFHIYETYGLPIEISQEIMTWWGVAFDEQTMREAKEAFIKHQELSRTASAGQFKSGLADSSQATTKYHTATHLLLAALRQALGGDIQQKGSNITPERIRFDFSFHRKITDEEIKNVENLVNQRIKDNLPVVCEEMETKKALDGGATGVFGRKYGDRVKVYTIGGPSASSGQVFSKEICAGPHIQNTSELGEFKIIKEESSSQGVRRIRAILQ